MQTTTTQHMEHLTLNHVFKTQLHVENIYQWWLMNTIKFSSVLIELNSHVVALLLGYLVKQPAFLKLSKEISLMGGS
jgi:hypothetical protein